MRENEYMSKAYTNCIKGLVAILVVVHQLYQYMGLFYGSYLGVIFQTIGFLCVAMFFFYSGYGLMLSSRKEHYMETFFRKRFWPLYTFYAVLILLYSLWTILLDGQFSLRLVLQSFVFGGTVVTNGWYLQALFVAYLLFYGCFKAFVHKGEPTRLFSFGIGLAAYIVLCLFLRLGVNWYQTIPCMLLGMVYCRKKREIDLCLKKRSFLSFVVTGALFAGCFLLSELSRAALLFDVLYSLFFVCAAVALSYMLCHSSLLNNKFFALCGNYSLEIYVSHGFFLRLIQLRYIENKWLYTGTVLLGTAIVSIIMKRIRHLINRCWKQHESN